MPEQAPEERVKNFKEVPKGFSVETAITEANRCLECGKPKCVSGCPVEIDIPGFVGLLQKGDLAGAAAKLKEQNSLSAVCGRVCPQEEQCEILCIRDKKGEPVSVGRLERFVADWDRDHGEDVIPHKEPPSGKRVAIVGSGPAGLAAGGDLAKLGHDVTIFEALHRAGGVLVYGIPEFRLPNNIVESEVNFVRKLGVKIVLDAVIGKLYTIDELLTEEGFDAVFIATGAGAPKFMNVPGENLCGIYSANEYLTRANLMGAFGFPHETDTPIAEGQRIAVLGGGNVTMDAARTAIRKGAEKVMVIYRRSREEMPARAEEIHHAEEEGVEFHFLTNPLSYKGDEKSNVTAATCIKMKLGEPDASGRRRPVPIEGSEFDLPVDMVILGIGTNANPLVPQSTPGMEANRWGNIIADEETGKTTKKGVWAGGDIVSGAATVILAMGAGKHAATSIHAYLNGDIPWEEGAPVAN
jgi:glutamate synthase (NADPH/NADH) small chain